MFEFDAQVYSKVDVVDYRKKFSGKQEGGLQEIRVDQFSTEEEMLEECKGILESDFHKDSFFKWMLVVKRMLFRNLFCKRESAIEEEGTGPTVEAFQVKRHKLFQFRALLLITKSFILFFSKIKELSNFLDTLKKFFSLDPCEREIKLIFKNLNRFFEVDSDYFQSKEKVPINLKQLTQKKGK